MPYVGDFETTTKADDCRVWAYSVCEIGNIDNCVIGNSIDAFIDFISNKGDTIYFHNLKFDGAFIVDWLFRHGYEHVIRERDEHRKFVPLEPGTFSTVISDMGQWYTFDVCWIDTELTTKFVDSLKLIPLSVEQIPKSFGLTSKKLSIDYKSEREIGHKLTLEEEEYVKVDTQIVAQAIEIMHERNQIKLTAASNALF